MTINEMLLRGCTLKNSRSIIGAVVYTGDESRIQKNSAKTPHKIGEQPLRLHHQLVQHAEQLPASLICMLCAPSALVAKGNQVLQYSLCR